jgi:hypothetical protein
MFHLFQPPRCLLSLSGDMVLRDVLYDGNPCFVLVQLFLEFHLHFYVLVILKFFAARKGKFKSVG